MKLGTKILVWAVVAILAVVFWRPLFVVFMILLVLLEWAMDFMAR